MRNIELPMIYMLPKPPSYSRLAAPLGEELKDKEQGPTSTALAPSPAM
jgi:hypothetical protein